MLSQERTARGNSLHGGKDRSVCLTQGKGGGSGIDSG